MSGQGGHVKIWECPAGDQEHMSPELGVMGLSPIEITTKNKQKKERERDGGPLEILRRAAARIKGQPWQTNDLKEGKE